MIRSTRVVATSAAALLAVGFGAASANAAAPTSQGDDFGVLYVAEMSDEKVYVGDIANPATALTTFWHETGSQVDQVAVTSDYVAWAADDTETLDSTIHNKVLVAKIGTVAANVEEIDIPGDSPVTALAADITTNLVYAVSGDTIYVINAATNAVTTSYSHSSVDDISWGMWVDGYNDRIYYCDGMENTGDIYGGDLSGVGVASNVNVIQFAANNACDGMGNDPVTGKVYMTAWGNDPQFASMNGDGTGSLDAITVAAPNALAAPSSMFVSHDTGKIYWTDEGFVYEMNFDGSSIRTLYSGSHPDGSGFQNLAVAFGVTLDEIANDSESLAPTGGNDIAATIAVILGLVALGVGVIARRRA